MDKEEAKVTPDPDLMDHIEIGARFSTPELVIAILLFVSLLLIVGGY